MEFIDPNYRIPARVVAAPLNGATEVDVNGGTWTATSVNTFTEVSIDTVSPDSRYTGNGVKINCKAAHLGNAAYGMWELPTPISANNPSLAFLIYGHPFVTTNFATRDLQVVATIDAGAGVVTNHHLGQRTIVMGRWNFIQFGGNKDAEITTATLNTGMTRGGTVGQDATFKKIRFDLPGLTSEAVAIHVHKFWYGLDSPKIVIISFDDGFATFKTVAEPILQGYGIKVTQNLIAGNATIGVGTAGKMTWAQIDSLDRSIVSFGNHTSKHVVTATVVSDSQATLQADIEACATELVNRGLNDEYNSAYHLAAPYGGCDYASIMSKYEGAARAAGMLSCRGTNSALEGYALPDTWHGSYLLMDYTSAGSRSKSLIRIIDNFINGKGGVLRLGAHDLGAGTTSVDYPVAEFTAVMKHLANKRDAGQIIIMTEAEYQSMAYVLDLGAAAV